MERLSRVRALPCSLLITPRGELGAAQPGARSALSYIPRGGRRAEPGDSPCRAIAHGVRSLPPGQVRGVLGVLILDGAGAVIRSTMEDKEDAKYASPVAQRLQRTLTLTPTLTLALTPTLTLTPTVTLSRWRSCCSVRTGWSA